MPSNFKPEIINIYLQKRHMKKYESENAFADVYGEYRELLELNTEWLPILKDEWEKIMSTLCQHHLMNPHLIFWRISKLTLPRLLPLI